MSQSARRLPRYHIWTPWGWTLCDQFTDAQARYAESGYQPCGECIIAAQLVAWQAWSILTAGAATPEVPEAFDALLHTGWSSLLDLEAAVDQVRHLKQPTYATADQAAAYGYIGYTPETEDKQW